MVHVVSLTFFATHLSVPLIPWLFMYLEYSLFVVMDTWYIVQHSAIICLVMIFSSAG